jgi:hypothetical protein
MCCISKTRAGGGKLVPFLDSASQIYPETGLTFEPPKCVLTSVICSKHVEDNIIEKKLLRKGVHLVGLAHASCWPCSRILLAHVS